MVKLHRSRRATAVVGVAAAVALWGSTAAAHAALQPLGLKTNGLAEPLGIGDSTPDFSWKLEGSGRSAVQSAYEVRVAPSAGQLGAGPYLWQSGKVSSGKQSDVVYSGDPLPSRQPAAWQVRVWDANGEPSAWSAPASFETGLLQQSDWGSARWIELAGRTNAQPLPIFARGFSRRQADQERAPVHERPRPVRGAGQRREAHRRGARARLHELPALRRVPDLRRDEQAPQRREHARRRARPGHGAQRQDGEPGPGRGADELVRVVEQHRGRQRHADRSGGGGRHQRQRLERRELLPRRHDQHRHRRRRRPARVAHDHRDRHGADQHDARASRPRPATRTSSSTASPAWPSAAS